MLLRRRAATTAGLTLLWLGGPSGCYVQRPLQVGATAQPAVTPGAVVSVTLNDAGRTALAANVGSTADRLEGRVLSTTDSTLVLSMRGSRALTGEVTRWTGESLAVPRSGVRSVEQRELSRRRTAVAVGLTAAAFVALAATRTLNIFGQPGRESSGGNPPAEQ